VRKAFQDDGFSFLLNVFNVVDYLEDLTGLSAMKLATDLSEVKFINTIKTKYSFLVF
jgi:hypothetical protein